MAYLYLAAFFGDAIIIDKQYAHREQSRSAQLDHTRVE
jgi:hypothetical protein